MEANQFPRGIVLSNRADWNDWKYSMLVYANKKESEDLLEGNLLKILQL
jgi:hypothetical protein